MIRAGIRRAFHLALRGRTRWEREVEEEIRLHLSLRAEQLVSRGASADDAYREAVARFGPLVESRARLIDAARHREQRMQRTEYFSDLRQDVSFAIRTLARQRAWTAVIICTFALGIGATTAVFSVVSRLMLHPVPYPNADRIVIVQQQPSSGNSTGLSVSIMPGTKVFRAWRAEAHSLESLVGYSASPVSMKTDGGPSVQNAARIVPDFPAFAGEHPIVGRMFTTADIASGERVVVLGESFWRQRLGGERSAIGRRLTLNDTLYTIIGVMPSTFALPGAGASAMSFWLPFDVRNDNDGLATLGRLRPGATLPAARAELDSIFARTGGFTSGKIPFTTVVARPGSLVSFRDSLIMLTAAVGLVLLIACANVAHLLVARGAARERELAIRAALGAAGGRLLRQLVTESLIISASGTALGLVLGWIGLHTMIALRPRSLSALAAAHLDATTVGVALALTVASGLVFGVIGSLQSARQSTNDALTSGAVGRGPRVRARVRGLIVVTEMALSATLLVGATMLIRSVVHLQRADLGFDPVNLYQVYEPVPKALATSTDKPARAAYFAELTGRLRRAGGVTAVSLAEVGPGSRRFSVGRLEIEGEAPPPATSSSFIDVNQVDPGFFATMRIPIVRGSTFTDTSTTTTQVIVNRGFAARHWPNAAALGRRIRIVDQGASDAPWLTIVGVADDASTTGPDLETSAPILYTPFDESGRPTLLVRTGGDSLALAHVRTIVAGAAQTRSVTIESVAARMAATITAPRFVMLLLTVLTGLALALAGVGLYGVMSFIVAQQTREIGIRVALGASRGRVARAILSRGTVLAGIGAAIGLIVSRWGTHLIENQLYGVTRSDPASFIVGALVLMSAALLACVVPTRRALAVDPMTAIRAD